MTERLRQLIDQIELLPAERQDAIAIRFLAELQNADAIDISDCWTEQDRLDVVDFSLQHGDLI
jgi:hypothetical protein